MPRATKGTLVECDPAILAILDKIDAEYMHVFIKERLDDEHLLVDTSKLDELKALLKDVRLRLSLVHTLMINEQS